MPYFLVDTRDGSVGQRVETIEETNPVASDYEWVEGVVGVTPHTHVYENGQFVDKPAPALGPKSWTPLAFMERFTKGERTAIRAAAKMDDDLDDWLDLLRASTVVRADDQRLIDGMAALVTVGLISEARKVAILA